MKILIIGASSNLCKEMLRNTSGIADRSLKIVVPNRSIRYGEKIPLEYLSGIDAVVNFALHFNRDYKKALYANTEGTLLWINQLKKLSSVKFLQISSDSVRFHPTSKYSNIKSNVENNILNRSNVRVFRIPTLIGKFTPPPSINVFRMLNFQSRAFKRVFVPEGFDKVRILQYLDSKSIWDKLCDAIEGDTVLNTPISHEPGQLFTMMELWKLHCELIGDGTKEEIHSTNIGISPIRGVFTMINRQKRYWFRDIESMLPFI